MTTHGEKTMKAQNHPYVFLTIAFVALLVASIAVAGCVNSGTKTPAPATIPVTTTVTTVTSNPASMPASPKSTTAPANPTQRQTITISGSTTVLPIVQAAADQYMADHPGVNIQVAGGGSGAGIQAIGAKTVDIGMSSREVTADEMKKFPAFVVIPVAQDGIAIIVNPANTIQFITPEQVRNIYQGKITKWTEITGASVPDTNNQIVIIGRDSASGTRTYFDEYFLSSATPVSTMLEKNSNGAVLQTVAQTPGAIGYVSIGFVDKTIKPVPIWYNAQKIVAPSTSTVKDKTYPASRSLYLITNGQGSGLTKDFIDYLLSPNGQKIVGDEGYVTSG
jgi:phosphate transport system substrate-binding protein